MRYLNLTAVIEPDEEGFTALCPELDIASQGDNLQLAKENLREAVELFLECADPSEVQARLRTDVFVTRLEVAYA